MTTVHDPLGPPILRTPKVTVTKTGEAYTVDTQSGVGAWKVATIAASLPVGTGLVQLPNGMAYGPGAKALLTADEAALISPSAIPSKVASVVDATTLVIEVAVPGASEDLNLSLASDPTVQLQARAGAGGPAVPSSDVRWSSGTPAAATVSGSGLVTAKVINAGVIITATWNGLTDTETVVVAA